MASNAEKLGITPEQIQSIGELGAMYYQQGELDKAQTIFEGLVEADEDSAAAQSALGALYMRKGEIDAAKPHLDKAIDLNKEQIAPFVNRAEYFLRKQDIEAAVADLKTAIELDPEEKDPGANRARAMVLGIYQEIEAQRAQHEAENN